MDTINAGVTFIIIYLDDNLVTCSDRQSHLQHLRIVLQRLQEKSLY
jgi:hypothetical protein